MKISVYRNGAPAGEREIPDDVLAAAKKVLQFMAADNMDELCGLALAAKMRQHRARENAYHGALTHAYSIINEVLS